MILSEYKVHVYLPQHKMLCLELFSVQLNLKKKNILCTVRENILNVAILIYFKKKLVINGIKLWITHYFNMIMC